MPEMGFSAMALLYRSGRISLSLERTKRSGDMRGGEGSAQPQKENPETYIGEHLPDQHRMSEATHKLHG